MNVLVYSGPGTTTESVKHCMESLKLHLSPYYAVVPISEVSILNDPWMFKTTALVMPGGADLPYCKELNGPGNDRIRKFVRSGGKYIGFCAGSYYASAMCEFELNTPLEVSGRRELAFFPDTAKGCAYSGFVYETHQGARATPLSVNTKALPKSPNTVFNYYNGGGVFMNASKHRGVEVLARYTEPLDIDMNGDQDNAAVIHIKVGKGDVLLTGTHPEFSASLLKPTGADDDQLTHIAGVLKDPEIVTNRKLFLQQCLAKLGLRVNQDLKNSVPKLTPLYLASSKPNKAYDVVSNLKNKLVFINNDTTLEDNNDTLVFHNATNANEHQYLTEEQSSGLLGEEDQDIEDPDSIPKHIKVFRGTDVPDPKFTPYFDMKTFFSHVQQLYDSENTPIGDFGSILGYGEVVTSTNTLMEKNPQMLRHLPNGFTLTATTQVAGRGRGGNVWINPKGVMALSTLFKMPTNSNQSSSVVTLQYLCGLAMIEAILGYGSLKAGKGVGYEDMPVKLKWPNDIYVLKPNFYHSIDDKVNTHSDTVEGDDLKYAKISGALINSQFLDRQFHLVWGCGVNVSNDAPTTSLNLVLEKLNEHRKAKGQEPLAPYKHELLSAKLMFILDQFFPVFIRSGLQPFLPLYYKRWFHSDQKVSVDIEGSGSNLKNCVIKGITSDYGLLIAQDIKTGERLELQPDGNSFDIFKGLVYKKR